MDDYTDTCAALIKQVHGKLEKNANNLLHEQDLTIMQAAVLVELDAAPDKTLPLKNLERTFGIAQPTMAGIAKRLEKKGLTETLGDPLDRRIKLVRLTAAGEKKCTFGYEHMQDVEETLAGILGEADYGEFLRMLRKVGESLA